MGAGSILVIAVFLAGLVEWIAERFFGQVKVLRGIGMIVISAAIGVGLCFGFRVDILELAGFSGDYLPWVGKLVSGLIIGSGSNALHKFIKPGSKKWAS